MTAPIDNALVLNDLAEANGELARLSATQTEALDRARLRLMHGDETAVLAVESILDLRVTMPVYRLADAEKTIKRLGKRAEKAGLPVPSIEVVTCETRDNASEWVTVRLLGAAPVLDGWTCVATIEPWRDSDGNEQATVYTAKDVKYPPVPITDETDHINLPIDFVATPSRCQHCSKNRRRNLTFVLRHTDGGFVQVGKTCLNEYLGTEALATWFVWCELQDTAREYDGIAFDYAAHAQWLADNAAAAARRDKTPWKAPTLHAFLVAVAAEIRVNDYAKADRYMGSIGTGRLVLQRMRNAAHEQPTEADVKIADGVVAWMDSLIQRGSMSNYLNYMLDCAAQANTNGVTQKIANGIASAVPSYLREQASSRIVERRNEILPGVQPGETIEITLTAERNLSFALACVDEHGRCVLLRGYQRQAELGTGIRVSGYVESMTVYNGTRQTILGNVRLIAAH